MVAALAALAAVRVLHPMLGAGSFMVVLVAVMAVAVPFGLKPALVTIVLSVAGIDFFFLAPKYSLALLAWTDVLLLTLFGGVAVLTTVMTESLRRGRARAERETQEAAGIASLMHRDASELSHEVDAMHALRQMRTDKDR